MAIGMAALSSATYGEIIASDTFSLSESVTSGLTVVGRTTEGVGRLRWAGSSSWIYADDPRSSVASDGILRTNGSNSIGLGLPFAMSDFSQYGSTVKVSFSSFYRYTDNGYLTFGFSSASDYSLSNTTGSVWVQINTKSLTWNLKSNSLDGGSNGTLASGALPSGINQYTWVDYSLTYDNATHTIIDFSVNGTSLVTNLVLSQAPTDFNKFVLWAQLPYSTTTGSGFDDFSLEVVPEPAGLGLLCLGVGGLCRCRFHKNKR